MLIPANMAQPTQDALNRLEDAVGDIDEFARKELGYESVEDLHNALMGLQVVFQRRLATMACAGSLAMA